MYGSCVLGGLAGGVADNTCGAGVCVQCSVEQNRRKRSTAGAAERAQRLQRLLRPRRRPRRRSQRASAAPQWRTVLTKLVFSMRRL